MKRYLILLIIFMVAFTAVFASDFGGTLQNFSNFNYDLEGNSELDLSTALTQNNKLSFWLNTELTDKLTLSAQLGWIFRYAYSSMDLYYDVSDFKPLELIKTLEVLRLNGEIIPDDSDLKAINYQAGRYQVVGASELLLKGTLDGGDVLFRWPDKSVRFGIWYNGFMDKSLSNIILSRADNNSFLDDLKVFASPRLIEYGELKFHNFASQEFVLFTAFQQDLYSETRLDELDGSHYFSGYLGAGMSGTITPGLFYSLTGIFNGGLYNFSGSSEGILQVAQLYEADLRYFFGGPLGPSFKVNFIYSSGDDWERSDWEGSSFADETGVSSMFIPISGGIQGYIFQPKIGNLSLLRAEYSIKPHRKLQIILSNTAFFRTVDGPVSVDTIAGAEGSYLGDEVSLGINFRPYSDLGISSMAGIFYPNEALVSTTGLEFRMNIYFSLSF